MPNSGEGIIFSVEQYLLLASINAGLDTQSVASVTCLSMSYMESYLVSYVYLPSYSLPSLTSLGWHYNVVYYET